MVRKFLNWLKWKWRHFKAVGLGFTPLGAEHHEHDIEFISRHEIAETGVRCRRCNKFIIDRGCFGSVRIFRFLDGTLNEGIRCTAEIDRNGVDQECGLLMLASPDTEHGDHLRKDMPYPEMLFFVRKDRREAMKEKYDPAITATDTPQGTVLTTDLTPLHPKE